MFREKGKLFFEGVPKRHMPHIMQQSGTTYRQQLGGARVSDRTLVQTPRHVVGAQTMVKARMHTTGVDIVRQTKLFNTPQALQCLRI
ncbi:MAG: hypothetical protein DDT34_01018 [Firmicutes bacterium]|nr:hypothetical protein [Bacillota bacterium]